LSNSIKAYNSLIFIWLFISLTSLYSSHSLAIEKESKENTLFYLHNQSTKSQEAFNKAYNKHINFDERIHISYFFKSQNYDYSSVMTKLNQAQNDKQKKSMYKNIIQKFDNFFFQINSMSSESIAKFRNNVLTKNDYTQLSAKHKVLSEELSRLKDELTSLLEQTNDIEEYFEDCEHTDVDNQCYVNCEITTRDPIFGNFRTEYNYSCVNKCKSKEGKEQQKFDSEERSCKNSNRELKNEINDIKRKYKPLKKDYDKKSKVVSKLEQQLKTMIL
jgi:hypothetical protein